MISIAETKMMIDKFGHKVWAHILKLRHDRGQSLNRNQVRCYRNALNLNIPHQ
jgi:hypothetical protein